MCPSLEEPEESRLGKLSDQKFARRFGRALSAVQRRRTRLGIPKFGSRRHHWTAEDDKLLGVRTDAEVAALLHTTVKVVGNRRGQFHIAPCARQIAQLRLAQTDSGVCAEPAAIVAITRPQRTS